MDGDLSTEDHYPTFEQLGPGVTRVTNDIFRRDIEEQINSDSQEWQDQLVIAEKLFFCFSDSGVELFRKTALEGTPRKNGSVISGNMYTKQMINPQNIVSKKDNSLAHPTTTPNYNLLCRE